MPCLIICHLFVIAIVCMTIIMLLVPFFPLSDYSYSRTNNYKMHVSDQQDHYSGSTNENEFDHRHNLTDHRTTVTNEHLEVDQPVKTSLDSYKESPSEPVSATDVQAILDGATSNSGLNLKKERSQMRKKAGTKRSRKNVDTDAKQPSDSSSSINMPRIPLKNSVTATSHILSSEFDSSRKTNKLHKRKRKHSLLEEEKSDSESEHIDVEGGFVPCLTVDTHIESSQITAAGLKQPFYANNDTKSRPTVPLVSFDRSKVRTKKGGAFEDDVSIDDNGSMLMDDDGSSEDVVHKRKLKNKKKKKMKKHKRHGDKNERD